MAEVLVKVRSAPIPMGGDLLLDWVRVAGRRTHIRLNGGAQIFLDDAVPCDFPVGAYLKVTYTEINGRKLASCISPSDSFHALDATL